MILRWCAIVIVAYAIMGPKEAYPDGPWWYFAVFGGLCFSINHLLIYPRRP